MTRYHYQYTRPEPERISYAISGAYEYVSYAVGNVEMFLIYHNGTISRVTELSSCEFRLSDDLISRMDTNEILRTARTNRLRD